MLKVIDGGAESNQAGAAAGVARSPIDEIVREGARRMLAAALQAEVAAYIEQFADELDADGRRLVVRNGYHNERKVMTSSGALAVRAPRVNDRRVDPETGESKRFSSAILPAWCRRSPQISEVLPLLYLHGLSTGDFGPALEQFLGSGAGLSSAWITRLTTQWQDEARAFAQRDLSGVDYAYLWAEGIHVNVSLDEARLCLLVLIGVRTDGAQATGRAHGRLPGGHGVVGGPAARYARCSRTQLNNAAGSTRSPMCLLRCRNRRTQG